jgi:hypothetical protein
LLDDVESEGIRSSFALLPAVNRWKGDPKLSGQPLLANAETLAHLTYESGNIDVLSHGAYHLIAHVMSQEKSD